MHAFDLNETSISINAFSRVLLRLRSCIIVHILISVLTLSCVPETRDLSSLHWNIPISSPSSQQPYEIRMIEDIIRVILMLVGC